MTRLHWVILAAVAFVAGLILMLLSTRVMGEGLAFMPRGGSDLLKAVAAANPPILREVAAGHRTDSQWLEYLASKSTLEPRERATLAAYLDVNGPFDPAAGVPAPPDGRMLAEEECQSCHSLFSSYLMQSRDLQGWRNIFLSPFHKQLKLDARKREEFARYSAINMPMRAEDVPSDMRF